MIIKQNIFIIFIILNYKLYVVEIISSLASKKILLYHCCKVTETVIRIANVK